MTSAASRVGVLALRLRIPAERADAQAALRARVESALIVEVLETLEGLLHARFGSAALIRVPRLALRWQLSETDLATPELALRLAQDLHDQLCEELGRLTASERLRPRPEATAIFASAMHRAAAELAEALDLQARSARDGASRALAQRVFAEALAAGAEEARELVHWLTRMERRESSLSQLDESLWRTLEASLPELALDLRLARARAAAVRELAPSAELASHAIEGRESAPQEEDAPPQGSAPSVEGWARAEAPESDGSDPPRAAASALACAAERPTTEELVRAHEMAVEEGDESLDTQYAGLFYLAGRVLEIELAERLWAAGVPEGDVLVHVAATLLGVSEPVCSWFGGVHQRAPNAPELEPWARDEIQSGVQHALGRRLVQFGLELSPAALRAQLDALEAQLTAPAGLPARLSESVISGAAALWSMVSARLARPLPLEELRLLFRRPGRLVRADDVLHVLMPGATLDVALRRAGLDQDPGFVPWLGRRLRFEFLGLSSE